MGCQYCASGARQCTEHIILFTNLDHKIQRDIAGLAEHRSLSRGEVLFHEGGAADSICILHEGRVKLNRYDVEGKETIFDILVKGDTIGEDLFMEGASYPYDVTAISEIKFCEIHRNDFMTLVQREPDVAINVIQSLCKKLKVANDRSRMLSENDAMMRLAAFLGERAMRIHGADVELTVDEIAGSINLRRETVSRKIQELQQQAMIKRVGQSRIRVIDYEALNRLLSQTHRINA